MPFWDFYQKLADWLDWPCPVSAGLQNPQDYFFLFCILSFIYFLKCETIVKSSARSFGHSDPDPNSEKGIFHVLSKIVVEKKSFNN